jgi:adenine deaminase
LAWSTFLPRLRSIRLTFDYNPLHGPHRFAKEERIAFLDRSWQAACRAANPAVYLKLKGKGFLGPKYDADLVVLNRMDLTPLYVPGKGQVLKTPTWVKQDMFEQ